MPARVTTYVEEVFTVVNTCGEEAFQTPPTHPLRIWSVKPTGFFEGNKFLSLLKTMIRSLWRP
jgi:hypothetical protein